MLGIVQNIYFEQQSKHILCHAEYLKLKEH
jgi:hypothetical protein